MAMTIILMMLEMHFLVFLSTAKKNEAWHEYYRKINSSLYGKLIPTS